MLWAMRYVLLGMFLLGCSHAVANADAQWCDERKAAASTLCGIKFINEVYFSVDRLSGWVNQRPGDVLDWSQLVHDADTIAKHYHERGYFNAKVKLCLRMRASQLNQVDAEFSIVAGERAWIRDIKMRGNTKVKTPELLDEIALKPKSPVAQLLGQSRFDKTRLDDDAKRLLAAYHRRGYLNAEVKSSWVEVSADLSSIVLVFDVGEGEAYRLANLSFEGDLPDGQDSRELRNLVALKDGDILNLEQLQSETDGLLAPLREQGYALARMEPNISFSSTQSIAVRYRVQKGPQLIVDKVRIEGNDTTQDRVIRRELPQVEGRVYRLSDVNIIRERLMALGYFSQVNVILAPSQREDACELVIRVTEQPTWLFSVLPMAQANEGLIVAGFVSYRNMFGSGLAASVSAQLSQLRQLFELGLLEPRLFDTQQSLSAELHRRQLQYQTFRSAFLGGGVRYGVPLGDYFRLGAGLRFDRVQVDEVQNFSQIQGSVDVPTDAFQSALELSFGFQVASAKAHRMKTSLQAEMYGVYAGSVTFSTTQFVDVGIVLQLMLSPLSRLKLKTKTNIATLLPLPGHLLPLSQRYFLGGQGSIRGYAPRSIGPAIGGALKMVQSVELEFPLASTPALNGYVFVDVGNAFLEGPVVGPLELFWSFGLGAIVTVLQMPLRVEVGIPLNPTASSLPFDLFVGFKSDF